MSYDKQKVISIALAEVGYLEKASKSQLDDKTANAGSANITKYARDLAEISYFNGNKQGVAWCATFVCWCFYKAYGKDAALTLTCQPKNTKNNAGAGCRYAMNYYKSKGQLHDTPKEGDQIFFYSADKASISHTGLVYKVDESYVYTVEGNTSSASGVIANGGAVAKKKYRLNYPRIAGYGRPKYTESAQEAGNGHESDSGSGMDEYTTYTVKKGDTMGKIARATLGKASRYPEIARLNNISNPNRISIGQKIKIPKA